MPQFKHIQSIIFVFYITSNNIAIVELIKNSLQHRKNNKVFGIEKPAKVC